MPDQMRVDVSDLKRLSRQMKKAGNPVGPRIGRALKAATDVIIRDAQARSAWESSIAATIKATGGIGSRGVSIKSGGQKSKHGGSAFPTGNYEFGGNGNPDAPTGAFRHPVFARNGSSKTTKHGRKRFTVVQTARPFLGPARDAHLQEFADTVVQAVADIIEMGE